MIEQKDKDMKAALDHAREMMNYFERDRNAEMDRRHRVEKTCHEDHCDKGFVWFCVGFAAVIFWLGYCILPRFLDNPEETKAKVTQMTDAKEMKTMKDLAKELTKVNNVIAIYEAEGYHITQK